MKNALLFKNYFLDFKNLFKFIDEKIKLLNLPNIGSSGTIIYIEKKIWKTELYSVNVGNSRCVLINRKGIIRVTYDDKIDDPKEYERIIKKRGIINNGDLCGALKQSRCFGNWSIKNQGLIVDPNITKIEINNDDLYLIIASDGIFDVIKDEEIYPFIKIYKDTNNICKNLVKECLNRGSTDIISYFVIRLN